MQRIEIFKLLDPQKAKNDRIKRNQLKYFFGGYNEFHYCKTTWEDGMIEEGWCGYVTCAECCQVAQDKYPNDLYGPVINCVCDDCY